MSWPKEVRETIKRLNNVTRILKGMFTDRDQAVELLALAIISQEHLLLVGPPGTAKTEIINRYTELLDMEGFNYLLTRFTEPSEIFGPMDLDAFQRGTYHIRTDSMLPEAQIAFLDEVFQGSSAILNSLLTILNERTFHNGSVKQPVPLISMIGATNAVPDDPSLRAFADRFALRLELDRVGDDLIDDLLEQGWELEQDRIEAAARAAMGQKPSRTLPGLKSEDVLTLHARLLEVDLSQVRPDYSRLIRELRAEGVELTDRRAIKGLKLVAGASLLRDADVAAIQDMWPLMHIWSRPEESDVIKGVVQPRLEEAGYQPLDTTRPVEDILMDLRTIQSQEPTIASEAAWGAHLMALNKLRRELINDHPKEPDARKQVEEAIELGLKQLEGSHV